MFVISVMFTGLMFFYSQPQGKWIEGLFCVCFPQYFHHLLSSPISPSYLPVPQACRLSEQCGAPLGAADTSPPQAK